MCFVLVHDIDLEIDKSHSENTKVANDKEECEEERLRTIANKERKVKS